MAKISIDVKEENLPIILNILENLKDDLINKLEVSNLQKVEPVSSSISNHQNKKYLSKDKYKQKLNQKIQEDEFLPKTASTNKYLSKDEFKKKLKGF